jgi:hypothetical protein
MKTRQFLFAGTVVLAALALTSQATAQSCVESPTGLVGWWPGDGTGSDLESGPDAKLLNGAGFAPGLVGDAFSLNNFDAGQDDSVVLPHLMVDGLGDMTVELWVNTTDSLGGIVSGANANANSSNELLLYVQTAAGITPWVKQSSAGVVPAAVSDGAWHHVAFTRRQATGSLYVDGVMVGALPYPPGPVDIGPHGLQLGQEQDCLAGCYDPDQALDGLFDEVAIYDRALTEAEIVSVFDAGAAGKCKPVPVPVGNETIATEEIDALHAEIDALNDRLTAQEQAIEDMESITPQQEQSHSRHWKHRGRHHDKGRKHRRW